MPHKAMMGNEGDDSGTLYERKRESEEQSNTSNNNNNRNKKTKKVFILI